MKKAILLLSSLFFFGQIFSQIVGDWERLGALQASEITSIDIKKNGAIYAGEYRSLDEGDIWKKHEESLYNINRNGTIFHTEKKKEIGTNRDIVEVRYSNDNGGSWKIKQIDDQNFGQMTSLSSGKWIAKSYRNSLSTFDLMFSTDEGDSWQFILSAANGSKKFIEVDDDIVFYPTERSFNNIGYLINLNNDQIQTGMIRIPVYNYPDSDLLKFTTDIEGNLWAIARSGIAKSTDSGFTWEESNFEINQPIKNTFGVPLQNGDFLAALTIQGEITYDSVVYFKSTHGGNTWDDFMPKNPVKFWHQYLPDGTVFGFAGGLVCSKDNGETWDAVNSPNLDYFIVDVKWFGKDSLFAIAGDRLHQSIDGGMHWKLFQKDKIDKWLSMSHLSENVNGKQLFGARTSVYLSEDFGQTFIDVSPNWNLISHNGSYYQYNLNITPNGDFVAASDKGLFISYDSGNSWTKTVDSLYFSKIKFSKNDVWIGQGYSPNSSIPMTYRSVDRGKTWEILPNLGYGYGFDLNKNDQLLFEKDRNIKISDDFGDSYEDYGILDEINRFRLDYSDNLLVNRTIYPKNDLQNDMQIPFVPTELISDTRWLTSSVTKLSPDNFLHLLIYKNGLYRFNISTTDFIKKSSIDNFNFQKNNIQLFPNPTQNTFTISFPEKQKTNSNLLIFNKLSQKVFEQKLPKNQSGHRIDGLFLPEGVYFYLIENEGAIIGNGKLIISKN